MNDRQLADLALTSALLGSAAIQRELRAGDLDVGTKSSPDDLVTSADKAAELAILDGIFSVRQKDAVLAEESGGREGSTGIRWEIDPIDGTMNFVHGRSDYAVSVGVSRHDRIVAGAIVRPADGDWAVACEGYAMSRDGALEVSGADSLPKSIVGIGLPPTLEAKLVVHGFVGELLGKVRDYRRSGSSACELFELAKGHSDLYLGFGVNMWDVAAGIALVEAAGGVCQWLTTASGLELLAAGTPALFEPIVELVKEI